MRKSFTTIFALLPLLCLGAAPAAAQNREHQQMSAELRILQEQTQQLALTLAQLGEAIKALNGRLDDVANATRKGLADQKLVVDALGNDLRVIRERSEDTTVRIGTLREEIEALRAPLLNFMTQAPSQAPVDPLDPTAVASAGTPPPPPVPAIAGQTPSRMFEIAWADYAAGQYSLAVTGFDALLKTFPSSDRADDAQFYIGESFFSQSRYPEAIAAYNQVIQNYSTGDQVAIAYYKRGLAHERMNDRDAARASYEYAVKTFSGSDAANLAKQRLDGLGPPSQRP